MAKADEPIDLKRSRQLAQRAVSATSGKEYITILEEAHLTLNWQEWSHFMSECRRLKDEREEQGSR